MRTFIRGVGQTLITAGLIVLLFAVYELYGTGIATERAQRELRGDLRTEWADAAPAGGTTHPVAFTVHAVREGQPLAILHIPRFGRGWRPRVIVEGVSVADLRVGPGHYPGTALPGQVGNFAIAGHRATHGNGFMRLNELVPGDLVVVEVQDAWLTYRVTGHEVVDPSDVSVIAPVPGDPGVPPTQPLITLTTCDPWYSAAHRLIVHGKLQSVTPKSAGLPAALAGG